MDGNVIAAIAVAAVAGFAIRGIMRLAKGKPCCGCPEEEGCTGEEAGSPAAE